MFAVAGSIDLWSGTREVGEGAKFAVFSQDLAQVPFLPAKLSNLPAA